MSEVKEMPQIDNSVAGEINTPVAGEIKVESTNQPISSEQTATEAMLPPLSPETSQDLNLAKANQPAVGEQAPIINSETAQETPSVVLEAPNVASETVPKPIAEKPGAVPEIYVKTSEPEVKKIVGPEALRNATNLTELIQAYQENLKENSNLSNLITLQNLMAEKLNQLGSPEEAMKFVLLAAQTENNLSFKQDVEHLADLKNRLSSDIGYLLAGLSAENDKFLRGRSNY